ncbi:DUF1918 domain-containing protein [Streptomyces sp. TRM49041]|uniref:DUF1918 domain-containing protein n=1 Tax=Streptomyces sp. TRM49041 TaxID=2603216 RepID=UPI0021CC7AE0|nr:DUF1918 domain-containing protein [Streptomyces sp. TRM49041]
MNTTESRGGGGGGHARDVRDVRDVGAREEHGGAMHAVLGDQILVDGPVVGVPRRDGEVVGLRHADGTPPYDVRWSDTGRVSLFFPGPDAHVRHLTGTRHPHK